MKRHHPWGRGEPRRLDGEQRKRVSVTHGCLRLRNKDPHHLLPSMPAACSRPTVCGPGGGSAQHAFHASTLTEPGDWLLLHCAPLPRKGQAGI